MNNAVCMAGRLTRDPTLAVMQNGSQAAFFCMAVTREHFDKRKRDMVKKTVFIDGVAWGPLGKNVAEACAKGMLVMVIGYLTSVREEVDGVEVDRYQLTAEHMAPSLVRHQVEVLSPPSGENGRHDRDSYQSEGNYSDGRADGDYRNSNDDDDYEYYD